MAPAEFMLWISLFHIFLLICWQKQSQKPLSVKFKDEIVQNNGPIIMGCSGFVVVLPRVRRQGRATCSSFISSEFVRETQQQL